MRLRITDPADRDLIELRRYGVRTYGERHADAYLLALHDEFRWIMDWPLTSREHSEVRPPVRLRVFGAHNILYKIAGDELAILRVLHHSADWINLL